MASATAESSRVKVDSPKDKHSISELAHQCIESFRQVTIISGANPQVAARIPALFLQRPGARPLLTLDDVYADHEQFRVWSRNLGVFAHDHGSLDFRLRGSDDVRGGIVSLLQSLNADLQICLIRLEIDRPDHARERASDSDSTSSDSDDTTNLQGMMDPLLKSTAQELQIRFRHISDIVDKLFRLAEAIRASGAHKRTTRAADYIHFENGVNLTEQFEKNYLPFMLRHRFKLESPLLERFVKAISLRRRRFLYQHRHQRRLAYGDDILERPAPNIVSHRLVPAISESQDLKRKQPVTSHIIAVPSIVHPPTRATTFENLPPRKQAPSRIVSGTSKLQVNSIEVPLPPVVEDRATYFECPYCCILVPKEKRAPRPWRDHIIGDLQPFICLEPECPVPDTVFESQTEWIEHQKWEHAMQWWCDQDQTGHPPLQFRSADEYRQHLLRSHRSQKAPDSIEKQISAAGRPSVTPFSCCPLCDFLPDDATLLDLEPAQERLTCAVNNQRRLQKHIADELLTIFLLALPDREDLDDVKSLTDQPASPGDTMLALSEISLRFNDHPERQEHEDTLQTFRPDVHQDDWNFMWESVKLQDSVREVYTGMENDEILRSIAAHQGTTDTLSNLVQTSDPGSQSLSTQQPQKCLHRLRRGSCVSQSHGSVQRTQSMGDSTSLQDSRNHLLASLSFVEMELRVSAIRELSLNTCTWLLQDDVYLDWVNSETFHQHDVLLWLVGGPGAGKSTLMKSACQNTVSTQSQHKPVITSFFFNARGSMLENSILGMYRTLLFQLLRQVPELQEILDQFHHCHEHHIRHPEWRIGILQELFLLAATKLEQRQLYCFIDASDIFDDENFHETIEPIIAFQQKALKSAIKIRMCFTSRHFQKVSCHEGYQLLLERSTGHHQDLSVYIHEHLQIERAQLDDITGQILNKANGVFLWAILVVDILNKDPKLGLTYNPREMLDKVPECVDDIIEYILGESQGSSAVRLLCLQWIMFARRPLTVKELYLGMSAELDTGSGDFSDAAMCETVLLASGGLAEIATANISTVRFIHDAIEDFILESDWFETMFELQSEIDSRHRRCSSYYCWSNDLLKGHCMDFLQISPPGGTFHDSTDATFSTQLTHQKDLKSSYPFLEYASQNVLYHADEAADEIPQDAFLESFPLNRWIEINNAFEPHNGQKYTLSASLLYILAEHGFSRLIEALCQDGLTMGNPGERYRWPLFAALANGHSDAVRALLQSKHNLVLDQYATTLEYGPTFSMDPGDTPLVWALRKGHEILAIAIVQSKEFSRGDEAEYILFEAIRYGYCRLVEILLNVVMFSFDLQISWWDAPSTTPLMAAAVAGRTEVVELLLERGAEAEIKNKDGSTALIEAAWSGHDAVVRVLLERGADIEATDSEGATALTEAAWSGREAVVRLLLERGANVEGSNMEGATALIEAAQYGRTSVVRLLLDHGADVRATNMVGKTAIALATQYRHEAVVRLLLESLSTKTLLATLFSNQDNMQYHSDKASDRGREHQNHE